MTRDFDRKEAERQSYLQDHSSNRYLKEEVDSLRRENEKLKRKVEKLQAEIIEYQKLETAWNNSLVVKK